MTRASRRRLSSRRVSLGAALAVGCLAAAPAQANIFDVFGAGARSQGMMGAVGALTSDYMAAFHNPAGLGGGPSSVGLSVIGSFNRTAIRLTPRPSGYDPPGYGDRINPRSDTINPDGFAGVAIGGAFKLLGENLTLGGVLFAPLDGFGTATSRFADEREQYFSNRLDFELMGGERLSNEIIAMGMAYRLRPWLSMGIGLMILPGAGVVAPVYVRNAADLSQVDINVNIDSEARRALTAGLIVRPVESLRIGAVFQDEIWFAVQGNSVVQLRGEEDKGPVLQSLDLVSAYSPARVSLSAAWVGEDGFTASVESTWRAWSRYRDNHAAQPGFNDTFDVKAGVEWPVSPGSHARAGIGYAPSPVPAQTGRTSYVDNDRIGVGFGAGADVTVWDLDLTIDVGFQVQAFITERVDKAAGDFPTCAEGVSRLCDELADTTMSNGTVSAAQTQGLQTGNPGFPGYTHGGYMVAASIDLKWRF